MAVDGPPDMGGQVIDSRRPGGAVSFLEGPSALEELAEMIAQRLAELMDARPLYTTESLAERLALSPRQVQEMIGGEEPEIRSFKLGRSRRIAPTEVDRFLARRQDLEPVGD